MRMRKFIFGALLLLLVLFLVNHPTRSADMVNQGTHHVKQGTDSAGTFLSNINLNW